MTGQLQKMVRFADLRLPGLARPNSAALWFAGLLALLVAVWAIAWAVTGRQLAWPRFHDDAFYYFRVAEQFANGNGFTIDDLHPTNGFHPVWMFILVAIFTIVPGGPMTALGVAQVVSLALVAGLGVITLKTLSGHVSKSSLVIVLAMLLFSRLLSSLVDGMESAVVTFAVGLFILAVVKTRTLDRREPTNDDWLIGVLLGFAFLSRLDLGFLVAATSAYVVLTSVLGQGGITLQIGQLIKKQVRILLPVLLMAMPYLAWNYFDFGSLVPVSGTIKSTFPEPDFVIDEIRRNIVHVLLIFPAFTGLLFAMRNPERFGRFRAPLAVGVMMMVVHTAYTELFVNWAVFVWYFAAYIPFGIIGAAVTVEGRGKVHRLVPVAAAVFAVLVAVASQVGSLSQLNDGFEADGDNHEFVVAAEMAGMWAADNLPEDARFGMKDSGSFSFHSQRNVTNLDGVISNMDYQEVLCTGELQDYLVAQGIDYFVAHRTDEAAFGDYGTAEFRVGCRLSGGQDSYIQVWESDEVYRGDMYFDGPFETRLIIWKLRASE